jgi:metallo-beta-lactamase class B
MLPMTRVFRSLALPAVVVLSTVAIAQGPLRPDQAIVCASCAAWNEPMKPFKVFGNTYYVGTAGLSSILVTSADGLILLDGALPQSAPEIDAHIRALGFRTADVRLILSSHPHFDHAGGIHALQQFTGATVAASPPTAAALQSGNLLPDDPQFALGPASTAFPAVATVRRVVDGQTLHVGNLAVTAHLTPGHTPGGTTWTWESCEGTRCLKVVYADSLNAVSADGFRFTGDATHPSIEASFRASIATVEQLPCDVLLSVHPDASHLPDKLKRRAADPESNPFVDPGSCRAYAADARETLDRRVADEKRGW